jgi:hypothetical protein
MAQLERHPSATAIGVAGLSGAGLAAAGVLSPIGLIIVAAAAVAAYGYRRRSRRPQGGARLTAAWQRLDYRRGALKEDKLRPSLTADGLRRASLRCASSSRLRARRDRWEVEDLELRGRTEQAGAGFADLHDRRRSLIARRRVLLGQPDSPRVRAELDELATQRRAMFAEWADLMDTTRGLGQEADRHASVGRLLDEEAERREETGQAATRHPLILRLIAADRRALERFEEWKAADERRYRALRQQLGLAVDDDGATNAAGSASRVDRQVAELWDMCWGDWPTVA